MKKNNSYFFALLIGISFFSCDDILEEDISDDQIIIISPLDGTTIDGNTVPFNWNELDGTNDYVLQVYSNSILVIDSTITSSPLNLVLNENTYEWRIKGRNDAYETQYNFPVSFEVVASLDLANQTVLLNNPTDNLYTNASSLIFTWTGIESADSYTFELEKVNGSGNTTVFFQEDILSTTMTIDNSVIDQDAEYLWKVKAVNTSSETIFSTRSFFIDTVVPPTPSLLTPSLGEEFLVDESISFTWDFGLDPGEIDSIITSVYEVATDDSFITIIESGAIIATNFNAIFTNVGTYYWRVRGEDEAGNIGAYNLNGNFIVNE